MTCNAKQRGRMHSIAHDFRQCPTVDAVSVLDPSDEPTDRWGLDIVVDGREIPPTLSTEIGYHNLAVYRTGRQGDKFQLVALLASL